MKNILRIASFVLLLAASLTMTSCIPGTSVPPDLCAAVKQMNTPEAYAALEQKRDDFEARVAERDAQADRMSLVLLAGKRVEERVASDN